MPKLRDGIHLEPVGPLEVNCYLVLPPGSSTLHVIDPGDDADKIWAAARELDFKDAIILLTHAHVDHISALGDLASKLKAEVYLHPDDLRLYQSPNNHLLPFVPPAEGLPEASWPPPEGAAFSFIHTPGHSRGGACYYFPALNALFSGDTLFNGSIGRTDFPGGDMAQLLSSIKDKLFKLPDGLEIFPGHGPPSSIGCEKSSNPYVQQH